MTLENKIQNLKPSESVILSSGNGITCSVERSTNGRKLRYVRTYANGSFVIFHTVKL